MKSSEFGIVQLPILIGLLILAVVLPTTMKVVSDSQDIRNRAAPVILDPTSTPPHYVPPIIINTPAPINPIIGCGVVDGMRRKPGDMWCDNERPNIIKKCLFTGEVVSGDKLCSSIIGCVAEKCDDGEVSEEVDCTCSPIDSGIIVPPAFPTPDDSVIIASVDNSRCSFCPTPTPTTKPTPTPIPEGCGIVDGANRVPGNVWCSEEMPRMVKKCLPGNQIISGDRFCSLVMGCVVEKCDDFDGRLIQTTDCSCSPIDRGDNLRCSFCPTPTPTRVPTSTPTSIPTRTPTPTRVPTSTPTSIPTRTPTPTRVPTSTPTSIPTRTPTPTRVPTSTPTSIPTRTPTPTKVLIPTRIIITPTPTLVVSCKTTGSYCDANYSCLSIQCSNLSKKNINCSCSEYVPGKDRTYCIKYCNSMVPKDSNLVCEPNSYNCSLSTGCMMDQCSSDGKKKNRVVSCDCGPILNGNIWYNRYCAAYCI